MTLSAITSGAVMVRLCVLLLGLLACQGPGTPNPSETRAVPLPAAVTTAPAVIPATASTPASAAPASAEAKITAQKTAKMPALPGPGWHRVTRILPTRLNHPIWDAKTKQTFAVEDQRVFAWDGQAWQLTPTPLSEGRSVLVAHPKGIHVIRLNGRKLFIHPLASPNTKPVHTVPAVMSGAAIQAAWHPTLKQIVVHLNDTSARFHQTWAYSGKRLTPLVAKAPYLNGMGWDGARMMGFDDRRAYHLDGSRWHLDPERLPADGRVFAPNGSLWVQYKALRRRTANGWQDLALPAGDFYGASLGFDVGRDQVLLRRSGGPDGGRTWVSTGGQPFAPIDMGPWWRPTTESFALVSSPAGLRHIHGRMGAISRLTPTGWRLEVADGLKIDPEWGVSFGYGRWGVSLLRLDPDGTLWRSHPWRRVKDGGDASRFYEPTFIDDGTRLIAHSSGNGATQMLEKNRWRQLSVSRDRAVPGSLVKTPKGIYFGAGYSLWRLVGDTWQHVSRTEAVSIEKMAFDAQASALLAIAVQDDDRDALMVFEAGAWRTLASLPDGVDAAETAFGVDSGLRRAVLMTEAGEVWMLDLDQHAYKGRLPTTPITR